jgi:hypothetical protein
MALRQARSILAAVERLPLAVAQTVERVLESSEILIYTIIGVGVLLIAAYIMEGVGYLIKESGHIGYVSAVIIDTFTNGILHAVGKFLRFFHVHAHLPDVELERHLTEFKSSNVHEICHELASYGAMATVFFKMGWSKHVCPILRYFTGTPIDDIIGPFISWASYNWAPEGNNCHEPPHLIICIVCEFYFFLRLLALVLVIVLIAAPSWPLVSDLIDIAFHCMLLSFDLIFDAGHWLAKIVHKVKSFRK